MIKRIGIVGGGYSGMTIAYFLQKKGYHVTVFEKEERLGGQCYTVFNKNEFCELGSVIGTSVELMSFLKDLGVEAEYKYFHRNFMKRDGIKCSQISPEKIERFQVEYQNLPKVLEKYKQVLSYSGWKNIPKELTQSFELWCMSNQLEALISAYAPHLVAFGFGKIKDIPAIYALKYLDLFTLSSMIEARKLIAFPNGTQEIIDKIRCHLEDVRLGSEVIKIEPQEDTKVTIDTGIYTEQFDEVIITVPLKKNVILENEHAKYMQIYKTNSYNVLSYISSEPCITTTYFKENFDDSERLLMLYSNKHYKLGRLLNAYAYGNDPMKILKEKIDRDIQQAGFKVEGLFAYKRWQTFPHVKGEDIANGFYDQVNAIQGKQGIYFSGGLTCFPTLDKLTIHIKAFIEEYF